MTRLLAEQSVRFGLIAAAVPLLVLGLYLSFSRDMSAGYGLIGASGLLSGLSGLGSVLAGDGPPSSGASRG